MVNTQSNSEDLIIMMKSIAQVEIIDGKGNSQEMNPLLLLKRSRTMTIGLSPLESHDPEGMNVLGVIDQGHAVVQDQGDVARVTHLMKKGGHDQKERRMSIDHPRITRGEMNLLHKINPGGISLGTSPRIKLNSQLCLSQQRVAPSLPPQATAPSPASQQAQALVAQGGACPNGHLLKLSRLHLHNSWRHR